MLTVVITVLGILALQPGRDPDPAGPAGPSEVPGYDSAVELTNRFLDAFTAGDAAAAGALTDDPAGAERTIGEVWRGLAPVSVVAGREELVEPAAGSTEAAERFTLTWDLGADRTWAYPGALRLVEADGWRVRWQPALVHPRLTAGQHLVLGDPVGRPAVRDRAGAPLLTWAAEGTSAADPRVAPVLLPALGRVASERNTGPGWYVALADSTGRERAMLHGKRVPALTTTLSRPVQRAAQVAVDSQGAAAMLVVVQPSTGDLLAVAQNAAAG